MGIMSLSDRLQASLLKKQLEKNAGFFSSVTSGTRKVLSDDVMKRLAAGVVIGAGLGLGGKAAIEGTEAVTSPISRALAFRKMVKENPWIKKENKTDVKRYFRTLHNFAPEMAHDPLVAGSFMRRSLEYKDEGLQPHMVSDLLDARRKIQDIKGGGVLAEAFSPKNVAGFAGKDLLAGG